MVKRIQKDRFFRGKFRMQRIHKHSQAEACLPRGVRSEGGKMKTSPYGEVEICTPSSDPLPW